MISNCEQKSLNESLSNYFSLSETKTLGIPYLQMMFLKFRYRLSDAALCREVANSISWQLVLPDPVRDTGGPSDPAEEAHHRVWRCGGRRAQRGLVGQGR